MENGFFLQASARAKRPVFHVRAAIRKNQGQLSSLFPGQFRDPVDKSSAVFSQPCRRKENFLPFAQRSELLLSGRADRFWLVDRQPFQEPAVFLAAEVPYFRRIPRPLEPAIIQLFRNAALLSGRSVFHRKGTGSCCKDLIHKYP